MHIALSSFRLPPLLLLLLLLLLPLLLPVQSQSSEASDTTSCSPTTGICSSNPSFTPPKDAEPSTSNQDQRFWLTEDDDANSESAASLLLRWMQLHASLHSGVGITSQSAGGFGMRAVVDIPAKTVIARLPYGKVMHSGIAFNSPFSFASPQFAEGFEYLRNRPQMPPELGCLLLIASEYSLGKESNWWPYFNALPLSDRHWSDWSAAKQQASAVLNQAYRGETSMNYFDRIYSAFERGGVLGEVASLFPPNMTHTSRDRLKWAYVVILSRAWSSPYQKKQGGRSAGDKIVIPGFDILNHDVAAMENTKAASVNFVDGEVLLVADHAFAAGDEIFTSYGAKSNAHLLFQYGFSLHPNRHDWIELAIPIRRNGENISLESARSAALEHVGLHHKTLIFSVGGCALPDDVANEYIFTDKYGCSREKTSGQPALITDEVMSLLRFYVATGIELEQLVQEQGFSVSMCLEKRAIALALDVLEKERDAIKKSDAGLYFPAVVSDQLNMHEAAIDTLELASRGLWKDELDFNDADDGDDDDDADQSARADGGMDSKLDPSIFHYECV